MQNVFSNNEERSQGDKSHAVDKTLFRRVPLRFRDHHVYPKSLSQLGAGGREACLATRGTDEKKDEKKTEADTGPSQSQREDPAKERRPLVPLSVSTV